MAKSAILQFEDCKTKRSRRTGTIPGNVVEALKTHRKVVIAERQLRGARWQDHDLIFPSGAGAPPDIRSLVRLHFDPYRKAAKLDKCSPYVLRHSHNSDLLAQGCQWQRSVREYLVHTIPGAEPVILDGVSHFAPLQRPALFNRAVLDFLSGLPTVQHVVNPPSAVE